MKTKLLFSIAAAVLPLTMFADLNSGLIAFYTFDGNAISSAGPGLKLSCNAVTYQTGLSGQAASFNGSTSYLQTSDNIPITGNQSRTVDVWLKANTFSGRGNLVFWGTWTGVGEGWGTYILDPTAGQSWASFHWLDYSSGPGAFQYSVGQWINLAITYDGNSRAVEFYLNGNDVGSYITYGDTSTQVDTAAGPTRVGYNNIGTPPDGEWNTPWNGLMDDLRIYNRALSSAEVQTLAAVPEPSTIALLGILTLVCAVRKFRK